MDTDFGSLARELRGGEEGPEVPPAYQDLVEPTPDATASSFDADDDEDLRRSG